MTENPTPDSGDDIRPVGSVVSWTDKLKELPDITGDEGLVKNSWEELDAWSYAFLWHCVVSF